VPLTGVRSGGCWFGRFVVGCKIVPMNNAPTIVTRFIMP
jgi:hypothetical protein